MADSSEMLELYDFEGVFLYFFQYVATFWFPSLIYSLSVLFNRFYPIPYLT